MNIGCVERLDGDLPKQAALEESSSSKAKGASEEDKRAGFQGIFSPEILPENLKHMARCDQLICCFC